MNVYQEDYGIDLHCTLFSERKGQLVWPEAYYSVQVKSNVEPWTFDRPESARWVLEYPAPLLLCIVQKSEGRVCIYQTVARFGATVAAELPASVALVPEGRGRGESFGAYGFDEATGNYLLGPPILEFKVEELLSDERFKELQKVLRFWVLNDFDNIQRYQMGMQSVAMPWRYTTNRVPESGTAIVSRYVPPVNRPKVEKRASELLEWLAPQWLNDDDYLGALLAVLMLRHSAQPIPLSVLSKLRDVTRLDAATATNSDDPAAAPLDKLLDGLGEQVQVNTPDTEANDGS